MTISRRTEIAQARDAVYYRIVNALHASGPMDSKALGELVPEANSRTIGHLRSRGWIGVQSGTMAILETTAAGRVSAGIKDDRSKLTPHRLLPMQTDPYKGLELKPNLTRPGSGDAYALPSLRSDGRAYPGGRFVPISQ